MPHRRDPVPPTEGAHQYLLDHVLGQVRVAGHDRGEAQQDAEAVREVIVVGHPPSGVQFYNAPESPFVETRSRTPYGKVGSWNSCTRARCGTFTRTVTT